MTPHASFPECLRPRLRLFLSIDLIGSTALKQEPTNRFQENKSEKPLSQLSRAVEWRSLMLFFYQRFQELISQKWEIANRKSRELFNIDIGQPKLWKAAGDELIYCQTIKDNYEVYFAASSWIDAARAFRSEIKERSSFLDVKMTAWLAGFPVINSEVVLMSDEDYSFKSNNSNIIAAHIRSLENYYNNTHKNNTVLDFIGPSMDIGFRLCNLSTCRQMSVSIELAFILSSIKKNSDHIHQQLPDYLTLRYAGRKELKGVLGGRLYPVFWLDTASDNILEKAEDKILQKKIIKEGDCIELVNAFIQEIDNPLLVCQPYLENRFSNIGPSEQPPIHNDIIQSWVKEYISVEQFDEEIEKSKSQPDSKNNYTTSDIPDINILS